MQVNSDTPEAWMTSGPGAQRRILCENPELMMVEFRFTVAGETRDLGPGDAMLIPSNAEHSCLCLEQGVLIDAFTPRRADFMEAHGLPTG